jgi:hypothetical protein
MPMKTGFQRVVLTVAALALVQKDTATRRKSQKNRFMGGRILG